MSATYFKKNFFTTQIWKKKKEHDKCLMFSLFLQSEIEFLNIYLRDSIWGRQREYNKELEETVRERGTRKYNRERESDKKRRREFEREKERHRVWETREEGVCKWEIARGRSMKIQVRERQESERKKQESAKDKKVQVCEREWEKVRGARECKCKWEREGQV